MSAPTVADTIVSTGTVRLPQVNLLPPEIGEAQRFRRVQVALAAAVLGAVAAVGLLYVGADRSVTDAETQVAASQAEQSRLQQEAATYREVTATYERAAAAETVLAQAMGGEVRYSRLLNDLSLAAPADLWLTDVGFDQASVPASAADTTPASGALAPAAPATAGAPVPAAEAGAAIGTVTMTGVAFTHDAVAAWLDVLAERRGYAAVSLQSSTEALLGTRKVVNWTLSARTTSAALSGRYTGGSAR